MATVAGQLRTVREQLERRDVRCAGCGGTAFVLEAVMVVPCTRFVPTAGGVGSGSALMIVAPLACEPCGGALTFVSMGYVDR